VAVVSLFSDGAGAEDVPAPHVHGQGEGHEGQFVERLREQEVGVVGEVVHGPSQQTQRLQVLRRRNRKTDRLPDRLVEPWKSNLKLK